MNWTSALHAGLIFLLAALLAGVQTSFWFQILGNLTPPLLWLIIFTYLATYRDGIPALFQLMFLALILSAFTAASLKVFYAVLLLNFILIYFIKGRIFWSGPGYFILICFLSAIGYHINFYLMQWLIERSAGDLLILERLTQILLTPAFAVPVYWVLTYLDGNFIQNDFKADLGGSTYE